MTDAWRQKFLEKPSDALSALFAGGGKGVAFRLETPEFLQQEFADSSADARSQLDHALYEWLHDMRVRYADRVRDLGHAVYTKRVVDAFIALQLTQLPRTRERIRASLDGWLPWLRPLRIAPERDAALECWRLMAIGQTNTHHESDWLRLAGDGRVEYLNVGLRGLVALPNQDDAWFNQTLLLQALFRHAVAVYPDATGARRFFNRRFAAIRARYPRSEPHWRGVLKGVLESNKYDSDGLAHELREQLRLDHESRRKILPVTVLNRLSSEHPLPSRAALKELEADINAGKRSPDTLTKRFFDLVEDHANYATGSGTGYYFVRSLHNLANLLLVAKAFAPNQMEPLHQRIQQAMSWEPWSPYCWMLLGDWYGAVGDVVMRESVMREMLRLFPDNEASRVELARILIKLGGEENHLEAGDWLREAVNLSDDHKYARVELARFLLRSEGDNKDEAEDLLRQVLDRDPKNSFALRLMSILRGSSPVNTSSAFEYATTERTDSDPPHVVERPVTTEWAKELLRRRELATEFARSERVRQRGLQAIAPSILRSANACDPLAGFYAQWLGLENLASCPPNAWAWQACQVWQKSSSVEQWSYLERRFPEAAPETSFLRILSEGKGAVTPEGWHVKFSRLIAEPHRTAVSYIGTRIQAISYVDSNRRDALAFAVLANRAAEPPVFANAAGT